MICVIQKVYVYKHANEAERAIKSYIQSGGKQEHIRVLAKNPDHGHLLEATTNVHIDYLYDIAAANQIADKAHDFDAAPFFFMQQSSGQTILPGVVSIEHINEHREYAIPSLTAYGLTEGAAEACLDELRAGNYLLFFENDQDDNNENNIDTYPENNNIDTFSENNNIDTFSENNYIDTALYASFDSADINTHKDANLSAININQAARIIDNE